VVDYPQFRMSSKNLPHGEALGRRLSAFLSGMGPISDRRLRHRIRAMFESPAVAAHAGSQNQLQPAQPPVSSAGLNPLTENKPAPADASSVPVKLDVGMGTAHDYKPAQLSLPPLATALDSSTPVPAPPSTAAVSLSSSAPVSSASPLLKAESTADISDPSATFLGLTEVSQPGAQPDTKSALGAASESTAERATHEELAAPLNGVDSSVPFAHPTPEVSTGLAAGSFGADLNAQPHIVGEADSLHDGSGAQTVQLSSDFLSSTGASAADGSVQSPRAAEEPRPGFPLLGATAPSDRQDAPQPPARGNKGEETAAPRNLA